MENGGLIKDHGNFLNRTEFNFALSETFEAIINLHRTIREYRLYADPNSAEWQEFILSTFHILGVNTKQPGNRLYFLHKMGENQHPVAICGYIYPKENFEQLAPGMDWVSYLFYAAKYHQLQWGILTDGLIYRLYDFNLKDFRTMYYEVDLDEIIQQDRLESFFNFYKVFAYLNGKTSPIEKQKSEKKSKRKRQVKVIDTGDYDLNYHKSRSSNLTNKMFESLRTQIFSLSSQVNENIRKMYIAYLVEKNFCEIHFQTHQLKIWVDLPIEKLNDPYGVCRDVRNIGHYSPGETEMILKNEEDIPVVFEIIKQAYEFNQ